jgi:hypothetical protein
MAVRGDEVASSIEAHVREAIERMVGEIRSSVEDVRTAVDSQLKAALQSVQADVNSIAFLPHIQKAIGGLEESLAAEHAAIAPVPVAGGAEGASRVKRAIRAVEGGKSQVDILNSLLEQGLEFGSRAALLILRNDTFSGWKGVGFSSHGGNDETIKRFNAAPGLIPELDHVLRDEQVVTWDGVNLSTRFGVTASSRAILVPMVIKDKVAAAVYVDAVEADQDKLDPASIEILVFATGLLIDTLAIRKKIPSPSLNEPGDAVAASTPTAAPKPASVAAPAPPPRVPPPPPAATAPPPPARVPTPPAPPRPTPPPASAATAATPAMQSPDATVQISAQQLRDMMGAPSPTPTFNMPSADEFSAPAPKPAPPPKPFAPPIPAPQAPPPAPAATAAAPAVTSDERPSTQYVPPSGLNRGAGPSGPGSEEAKKHDEARRFARLLVSEIKLYNEAKVEQGRKNKDLYERLKEDIDRSRQMYDERIDTEVRKTSNYFYDELVRILADGRSEALGL